MTPALNPDIFSFFSELENNNTREWFEPQKARFKALEERDETVCFRLNFGNE